MVWNVEFGYSVPVSLWTMLHLPSSRTVSKARVTSRADFVRTDIIQARFETGDSITVRLSRRIFKCFYGELPSLGIHLPREICKLCGVPRVPEEDYVMCVETNGARELVLGKEIFARNTTLTFLW